MYYNRVREYYNKLSSVYEKLYRDEQLRKIQRIIGFIPKGKILDIGAGTGIVEEFLNGDIYLFDISEKMLEIARKKFGNRFKYFVGNAKKLPFQDNFFDAVISISVLQDILEEDIFDVLSEIIRVLKEGGIVILTFIKKDFILNALSKFDGCFEKVFEYYDGKEFYFVGQKIYKRKGKGKRSPLVRGDGEVGQAKERILTILAKGKGKEDISKNKELA